MSFGDETDTEPATLDGEAFRAFVTELRARLEQGAREYGNASLERPPLELLNELHQEALDLAGWGFVLATRIARLKRRVQEEPCKD